MKKNKDDISEIQENKDTIAENSEDKLTSPEELKKMVNGKRYIDKRDPVESIKNVIDNALDDEDVDVSEPTDAVIEGVPKKKKSFKRNMYFSIGVVVSVLSVIGFLFTLNWAIGLFKDVINNTSQKEEFAKFIYPVVINDPASFQDNQHISPDVIISSAIWDIILYSNKEKYPSEYGNITIPQVDVELHATNIFGKGLTFNHKTVGDASLTFYYSEETKSYTVPESPQYFPYSPMVQDISKNGNTYTLKVGYVSPSPQWLLVTKNKAQVKFDKFMDYVVTINNNDYTLTAIKESDSNKTDIVNPM